MATKKGRGRRRELTIKVRVKVLHRMRAETVRLLTDRAMREGIVPPGIEIHWIDWSKEGKYLTGYVYEGEAVPDALRAVFNIMSAPGARRRFEPAKPDADGQG